MKQELSLEVLNDPANVVLGQVAQALQALQLPLEGFVWSAMPETAEARIWLTFAEHETKLCELTASLGLIPGVRRISTHGPGQSLKEAFLLTETDRAEPR